MSKPRPTVLFIPGSYTLLSTYQSLFDALSKEGISIQGIELPTIGPAPQQGRDIPAPSMFDDVTAIAEAAKQLADQGKDIVLIGHSYAGAPMSQCTKGLSKRERQDESLKGGIVHLGYMAALVPAVGQSCAGLLEGVEDAVSPELEVDELGWARISNTSSFGQILCPELHESKGKAIVDGFARHSGRSFADELTHAGYVDIPASYLLSERDRAGPPAFQRGMIAQMEKAAGGRKVLVTSVDAGHMAAVSRTKEVAEWVGGIVRSC